jgi:hypothetical protein
MYLICKEETVGEGAVGVMNTSKRSLSNGLQSAVGASITSLHSFLNISVYLSSSCSLELSDIFGSIMGRAAESRASISRESLVTHETPRQ